MLDLGSFRLGMVRVGQAIKADEFGKVKVM